MINPTIPELIVNAKSNSDGLMMIVDYWIKIYTGDKKKWILNGLTQAIYKTSSVDIYQYLSIIYFLIHIIHQASRVIPKGPGLPSKPGPQASTQK
jgi:hypothetical protein